MLGAVADEAQGALLLPITGVHHAHVQPRYARTQRVVRRVAAAALNLSPNPLPASRAYHIRDLHRQPGVILGFSSNLRLKA